MESNGVEGNIMISEATKNMLEADKKNLYDFKFLKKVDVKGSEPIKSFLIMSKAEEEEININKE